MLLRKVNLSDASLIETELSNAEVEKDWLERLDDWRIDGAEEIQESYNGVDITSEKDEIIRYCLEKK